jgi:hypothetical protein
MPRRDVRVGRNVQCWCPKDGGALVNTRTEQDHARKVARLARRTAAAQASRDRVDHEQKNEEREQTPYEPAPYYPAPRENAPHKHASVSVRDYVPGEDSDEYVIDSSYSSSDSDDESTSESSLRYVHCFSYAHATHTRTRAHTHPHTRTRQRPQEPTHAHTRTNTRTLSHTLYSRTINHYSSLFHTIPLLFC